MKFNVILFDDFETLDVFGPVEVMGRLAEIEHYSEKGGIVKSRQNVRVETLPISSIKEDGILFIPGGYGTRGEVNNEKLIGYIKELSQRAQFVLTVCTGSALLARTGLLKGHRATSNKVAFDWVVEQDKDVEWIRKARWVKDGKYYTSSGVSAGIDMALGFISDIYGTETAENTAKHIEYIWNKDKDFDPFSRD